MHFSASNTSLILILFSPVYFHPSRKFQLSACIMRCLKSKLVIHWLRALFLLKQEVTSLQGFMQILIGWPTWKNEWYTPIHFCSFCIFYKLVPFARILSSDTV